MQPTFAVGLWALLSLLCVSACGSSTHAGPSGEVTGNAGAGGAGVTAGSGSVALGGASNGGAGSSTVDNACAETTQLGQLVPLDIYVMLDISSSMLDATGTGANAPTKWDAVKQALSAFLGDPASAGIGVGIQYFPLNDPSVPASCTTDAECGTHGPCFEKFCANAGPGFLPCGTNADCSVNGQALGPCTPLTYCYLATSLVLCHDASECGAGDACVPFNECSNDNTFACPAAGQSCGTSMGRQLGTCRAFNPPSVCTHPSSCSAAMYATPAVDIAALPASAAAILASIDSETPLGNTPTAPALAGAVQKATSWAAAHGGHRVVVLLATDGLPTECIANPTTDPMGINGVLSAAAAGVNGTPSVSTFVIGVFGPTDAGASANLNQIASAGGTNTAFIVDTTGDVAAQFLAALNKIRASQLGCEYALPTAPSGQSLDYSLVNVDFTNAGATERLIGVGSAAECDPTLGGWYYDEDPTTGGTPTKILICPASCTNLENAQQGSVKIALGCQTRVR